MATKGSSRLVKRKSGMSFVAVSILIIILKITNKRIEKMMTFSQKAKKSYFLAA